MSPRFVDRWMVLQLLKDIRHELGLTRNEISVVSAHLSVLPKGPLNPAALNMSYMQVAKLLERADCMSTSTFCRSERSLEKKGLIIRRLSANSRRFCQKSQGKVVDAYGIDLAPLLHRLDELQGIREEMIARKESEKNIRTRISCSLRDIKRNFADGSETVLTQIESLCEDVQRFLKRVSNSIADLEEIERQVLEFHPDVEEALEPPCPAPSERAFTAVSAHSASVKTEVDVGQNDRHIESQQKYINKPQAPKAELEFNPHRLSIAWREARALCDLYPEPPRSERQMARLLFDFSSFMGLGPDITPKALATLGWEGLIQTLDYLAGRIDQISKPQGYLKSMLRSYEQGEAIAGGRVRPTCKADLPFSLDAR